MATALIQFTQGATTGTAGQALDVTTGTSVTVANNSNTGVSSWQIDLVDVPSGSALTTGTIAHSDNGSTPSGSFTPDIAGGCYRVVLYVWTVINRAGTPADTDIRNAVVLDSNGYAIPPSQIWPFPLPSTASGMPGNKPNELNLGGQERGWAGAGTDGLLDQRLRGPVNVSAGTKSNNVSALVFSNSNSVSFGLSGSTVTATVSYPAQTNQTAGLYALGNTTQNSSTTLDARTLSFNGLGIVTVGYSNGSIQISATTAQSVQTVGLYALGHTTQNSSTTLDARTLSFNGLGIVTVGYSNGSIQVSATQSVQTQNVVAVQAGTQTATSGTVIFSNSNGISFGMSNSSVVTASYTVPVQTNQTVGLYALGNTTQNSSTTLDARTLSFNGLGGATVGYSNGSIQISAPQTVAQTNQTVGLYALGNTTQNSSTTLDARTISYNGLGIVTVGYSNGSVQISATTAAQTNQTEGWVATGNTAGQSSSTTFDARSITVSGAGIVTVGYSVSRLIISATAGAGSLNLSAGTTSNNLTAVTFANGGGVSFGLNGSTVTASVATSLTNINVSAGTTSNNLSAIVFSNSNGLAFGMNGSTVTGSYTVPTQSVQTIGLYAVSNSTQNSSTTLDARTLSFNGAGIASVGFSNGSVIISVPSGGGAGDGVNIIAAGTQTAATTGTVVFSNSNNISFGMSNSSIVTASYNQSNQTVGFYAVGNTTQNSSTTLDARTISYNGLGALSVGYSNGSVQVSAPNTSSLVGVGGVIVSTNGSTISVSGENFSNYEPQALVNTATFGPGQNTWYIEPFEIPANFAGGRINRIFNFNTGSASNQSNFVITNAASFGTGTTGSISNGYTFINNAALYSLDAGTNSTRLVSFWSNSNSFALSRTMSISQNGGTAISVSLGISMSYINSIDISGNYTTTQLTSTKSTSSANSVLNTTAVSTFYSSFYNMLSSGNIIFPIGLNTTINPGNYWLGQMLSTTSATGGTALSLFGTSNMINYTLPTATAYRVFGQTASVNSALAIGAGSFSATSASPPSTMNFTQINTLATRQYFNLLVSTI